MNKKDMRLAKKKILKCLVEDFDYGDNKTNQAIFDKSEGWAVFSRTDLEMVMDKVMLGLYFALCDSEDKNENIIS